MRTFIIVVVVLAVVGVVVWLVTRHQANRRATALATLTPQQVALHEQCALADAAEKQATKAYETSVARAEKELKQAERVDKLVTVSRAWVSPLQVHLQGVTYPMSPAVEATMDESGTVTSHVRDKAIKGKNVDVGVGAGSVRRGVAIGGGVKSGRSKTRIQHEVVTTDDRQLYITVSGQGWSDVVKVPATEGEKARRFVAATNAAAGNFDTFSSQHEERVSAARRSLATTKADTGAMNQAISARKALGPDPLREALARSK